MDKALELVPYDPAWPRDFAAERDRIATVLGDLALRIDHNGSTSIPGLAAKLIIDIQISVERLHPIEAYAPQLAELGYVHVPHPDDAFGPYLPSARRLAAHASCARRSGGGRRGAAHAGISGLPERARPGCMRIRGTQASPCRSVQRSAAFPSSGVCGGEGGFHRADRRASARRGSSARAMRSAVYQAHETAGAVRR